MKIENEFTVHAPINQAWKVLTDLEGIAPCLPGATLTGVDGDVYQGRVRIKVGPVISEFAGTAQFASKDDAAYRAVIDAKGRDRRSAGNASAVITALLRPSGSSTVVSVDTDLKISGKLAQFGSGMIKEVSQKLLAQFVASLEAKITTDQDGTSPVASPPSGDVPAPAPPADALPEAAEPFPRADLLPAVGDTSEPVRALTPADEAGVVNGTPVLRTGSRPAVGGGPGSAEAGGSRAEAEPLDFLELAGGSIRKRLIPVAAGVVVVVAAIVAWRTIAR